MKVDGKAIAKANLAQRASNQNDAKEATNSEEEQIVDRGAHIDHMFSFIEAMHSKDPSSAHKHMMAYAQSMSKSE